MKKRSALIAGGTGLVGRYCLDLLLEEPRYARIVTLGRRAPDRSHPRLIHHVVDFDHLSDAPFDGIDDVFCCLGTTIGQAGSQEAFRKVDFDYPFDLARRALAHGATHYLLVSALGADSGSRIFYNRVKGDVEAAIGALDFDGVSIFRPSLLTGDRKEGRIGEQIGEVVLNGLSFLLQGPLRKYRPTSAADVAAGMVLAALNQPDGVQLYEPDRLYALLATDASRQE